MTLVTAVCQANTVTQPIPSQMSDTFSLWGILSYICCLPCIQVTNSLIFGGANSAVQWYWAPAIGQIEAISAKDRASAMVPEREKTMPQIRATGPPLIRPGAKPL
jgi:hypothetical protein